jgi:hypothetical protein
MLERVCDTTNLWFLLVNASHLLLGFSIPLTMPPRKQPPQQDPEEEDDALVASKKFKEMMHMMES